MRRGQSVGVFHSPSVKGVQRVARLSQTCSCLAISSWSLIQVLPILLPRCAMAGYSLWIAVYASRVTPLRGDELGIGPVGSDQVSVASAGDYLSVVDHDHTVSRED